MQLQIDAVNQDWVAHRDQIRCALGPHDARDLCHCQHVALLHPAAFDEGEGIIVHQNTSSRDGGTDADGLFADVDHFGAALLVKMRKILHRSASDLVHVAPGAAAVGSVQRTVPGRFT